MKKILALALALSSSNLMAVGPQFSNLSKNDVENVAREFSATFSHTGVSAPETDGLWGLEVGALAGQSKTADLASVIDRSGGKGSDFENLYHAGLMVRAHFPLELFAEVTLLPEQDFSDVKVKNTTYELGWNAGRFFNLPLDLALGANFANSTLSFSQAASGSTPASTVDIDSKTNILWIGASKSFGPLTPYVKLGQAKADSDVKATASIFQYTGSQNEEVMSDGGYFAVGANLQLLFIKLGVEVSQIMEVQRASAKISLDF